MTPGVIARTITRNPTLFLILLATITIGMLLVILLIEELRNLLLQALGSLLGAGICLLWLKMDKGVRVYGWGDTEIPASGFGIFIPIFGLPASVIFFVKNIAELTHGVFALPFQPFLDKEASDVAALYFLGLTIVLLLAYMLRNRFDIDFMKSKNEKLFSAIDHRDFQKVKSLIERNKALANQPSWDYGGGIVGDKPLERTFEYIGYSKNPLLYDIATLLLNESTPQTINDYNKYFLTLFSTWPILSTEENQDNQGFYTLAEQLLSYGANINGQMHEDEVVYANKTPLDVSLRKISISISEPLSLDSSSRFDLFDKDPTEKALIKRIDFLLLNGAKPTSENMQDLQIVEQYKIMRCWAPISLITRNSCKMKPDEPCWCGSGKKYRVCHGKRDL